MAVFSAKSYAILMHRLKSDIVKLMNVFPVLDLPYGLQRLSVQTADALRDFEFYDKRRFPARRGIYEYIASSSVS